ncbi:MAG: preprotein translocase subunit YajC [Alphaproteobacteria bacterium]|nr:preprotein translocase subunit YajC [Alphaproteobacteria bacterium]
MDGEPSLIIQLAPLILIFVVFYFLLIRPQQKRMKEHREMLSNLRRGDRVVTGGGIIGQIVKVGDDELTVEIGEGMRVKVLRSTVSSVLSKPEPARGGSGGRGGRQQKEREPAEDEEEPAAEEGEAKPERKGGRFLSRK